MDPPPIRHAAARMAVLASGNALMIVVSVALMPALPAMARHFGSVPLAQIILLSPVVLKVIGAPAAAVLMRRFGRRRPLLACLLLLAAAGGAAIVVDPFWAQLALRLVMGFTGASIATISTTLAGDYFEGAQRNRALSWLGVSPQVGSVLGLFGGGALAQAFGWQWANALLVLAIPAFIAAWLLLPEPALARNATPADARAPAAAVPAGFAGFLCLCAFAAFVAVFGGYQLPFLFAERGLESAAFAGTVLAIGSILAGAAASAYPALRRQLGSQGVFCWVMFVCGLLYCVLALSPSKIVLALLVPALGLGAGLMFPFCTGGAIDRSSAAARPRAVGYTMSAIFIGQVVSPFLAEPIRRSHGAHGALMTTGVLAIALGLAVLARQRLVAAESNAGRTVATEA